jgi:chitin synthase
VRVISCKQCLVCLKLISTRRGITGSGKTHASRLIVDQLLRLSAHSKRESKLAEQVKSMFTILDSFGNAKTLSSPNASRHGRYLELHFTDRGRIDAAKVLTYALDKSRLVRLQHEERTFHVFYQLLAGATPEERDALGLEDPSDYALLASSGCYRLPSGPFSDDNIAMGDTRAALRALGFKSKHTSAIFALLAAILVLGNVQFTDGDYKDTSAWVANQLVLDQAARLLGVPGDELGTLLTNKTTYIRKELYTVLLDAAGARAQRDQFVRDLYAILFAFVVEHANHRIAPGAQDPPPLTQIVLVDQPGYQSRTPSGTGSMMLGAAPLIAINGHNGFDEFCINFADELLASYVLRNTFDDAVGLGAQLAADGIPLPTTPTIDNGACVELLRGATLAERASRKPGGVLGSMNKASSSFRSGKSGDARDAELLQDLLSKFGAHASFISSSGASDRSTFGISHYGGPCSYDIKDFIEKDTDVLDPSFVTLLRGSSESFVAKLLSGPSMATERHHADESILVSAQVSSRPLRTPTPILAPDGSTGEEYALLDPAKVYPVTTQVNHVVSELLRHLSQTRLWTVSCIRPNDSGSPNSFDKRRVKAQIKALLLPDMLARTRGALDIEYSQDAFCERYVPTMGGEPKDRITQAAHANGWREGVDYALGHRSAWFTYGAWKMAEDALRTTEREGRKPSGETYEDEPDGDEVSDYTHEDTGMSTRSPRFRNAPEDPFSSSRDRSYSAAGSPGGGYGYGGMPSPHVGGTPAYSETGDSGWGDDKKGGPPPDAPTLAKEAGGAAGTNAISKPVEMEIPTSRSRRIWLWVVWGLTGWIVDWFLEKIGRMKRPDIRLAWREKLTICLLIFLLNGIVIFYIIEFGRLLCPRFDKAWSINEVAQHTTDSDYWVAIQGFVYDVTDFVQGDHSDITGQKSNSQDALEQLAGIDMTKYFPVPPALACPGLVTDASVTVQYQNFNAQPVTAVHTTGNSASKALSQKDWYTSTFLPKIKQYRKGPLVVTMKNIAARGKNDTDTL